MSTERLKGLHASPVAHLEKLRRIVRRIDTQEMHVDDLDDFCKTAWHLIERVERDPRLRHDLKRRASALRSDQDIVLCQHFTNTEKHGARSDKVAAKVALDHVEVGRGWGIGGFGKGGFGVGEQHIIFKFINGAERDAMDFSAAVLAKWEAVFA